MSFVSEVHAERDPVRRAQQLEPPWVGTVLRPPRYRDRAAVEAVAKLEVRIDRRHPRSLAHRPALRSGIFHSPV